MSRDENQLVSENEDLIHELEDSNKRGLLQLALVVPALLSLTGAMWGML